MSTTADQTQICQQTGEKERSEQPVSADLLPPYTKSLLKVPLQLSVVLAERRESVEQILELAPGTILTFPRKADQLVELNVGSQKTASGILVKVGHKVGLQITQITDFPRDFSAVRASGQ
jgi:flagellar motor switch protein FliN